MKFLLRKVKYRDGSTSYMLIIKNNGAVTQVKLKASQYKEMKESKAIEFAEFTEADFKGTYYVPDS